MEFLYNYCTVLNLFAFCICCLLTCLSLWYYWVLPGFCFQNPQQRSCFQKVVFSNPEVQQMDSKFGAKEGKVWKGFLNSKTLKDWILKLRFFLLVKFQACRHLNYMAHVGIVLEGFSKHHNCFVRWFKTSMLSSNIYDLCREKLPGLQLDKQTSHMKPSGLGICRCFYWRKLHLVGG